MLAWPRWVCSAPTPDVVRHSRWVAFVPINDIINRSRRRRSEGLEVGRNVLVPPPRCPVHALLTVPPSFPYVGRTLALAASNADPSLPIGTGLLGLGRARADPFVACKNRENGGPPT